ncbi:MAG: polysaccharide deacetylase [Magnetospirillum sp.]|nr:MAG: polysaccharide deacetylase [Magnetospirillum sp.]
MSLTIVMYHYVRDLERSRYPAIKGRTTADFSRQLDHIAQTYRVVRAEEVVAAAKGGPALPDNAAWLTFDDGYLDHYTTVFPLLHERGWQGSFFPPVKTVVDRQLLDVNKIHFILAAEPDTQAIIAEIRVFLDQHGDGVPFESYWRELAQPSRFDPAAVIFIKRLLQHRLPEALRNQLTQALFHRFVSTDPAMFAAEVYMSVDQLKAMIRCGMYVGSHGAHHYWFDRLTAGQQAAEIDVSLAFLAELGAPTQDWVMCYPYGAYNDETLPLLRARGCAVALTTEVAVARIGVHSPLALPRLDTNDLPPSRLSA